MNDTDSQPPEGWGDSWDPFDGADTPEAKKADERGRRRRAAWGQALQRIRKAEQLTQMALADRLGVSQKEVSRIEGQSDLLLSTLSGYVAAMGDELVIRVRTAGGEELDLLPDDTEALVGPRRH